MYIYRYDSFTCTSTTTISTTNYYKFFYYDTITITSTNITKYYLLLLLQLLLRRLLLLLMLLLLLLLPLLLILLPRRWRIGFERSPYMRNIGCSNPSRVKPNVIKIGIAPFKHSPVGVSVTSPRRWPL